MAELGTFEKLVGELGQALLPLRDALASPDAFVGLLTELGWTVTDIPQPLRDLGTSLDTLYDGLHRLLGDGGINQGGPSGTPDAPTAGVSADEVSRVLSALQSVVNGIRAIANAPDSAIPAALRADGFPALFPGQLLDYLVISYLQRFHPSIGFALRALGVIKSSYQPTTGGRPPHLHLSLDLTDLPQVLADPSLVLKNAYGWGEPDFDFAALASQVDNLMMALGLDVYIDEVSASTAVAVAGQPPDPFEVPPEAVRVVAFDQTVSDEAAVEARTTGAVRLLPVPARDAGTAPGLALLPSFVGASGFQLPLGPDLTVTVKSDLDLQGGVGLLVRPGEPIEMILGFESGDGTPVHATGAIEVSAQRAAADGTPVVLLGAPDRTRLQFRSIGGTGGIRLTDDGVDAFAEFDILGLEFVFQPDDADGFITTILPSDGFTLRGDLAVGISHRTGFYFRGTSNLEIQLPARQQLGPIEMQGLTVAANPSGDTLPIALGATFKVGLGPIVAVVDRIGLIARFTARPQHDGNLGPVDVSLGFKPPNSVGLSINAGTVSGGGFLGYDPDRAEYSGVLDLEFADFLALKAIGLITTRMPDGSAGFSLLLVITAEFGNGIQLGFGFTLLAVGGLIGLNRGLNLQALVEGVRTGAIEAVAFPRDVIANAPRILSDLSRFFPPEQGTFLIGPMAKIGWGSPTLISISLGLIIEIPGNIAVVGVLRATLPTVQLPLLQLQVDFVGALEPDKSRLWFFARLFDSRILAMPIDGGMGLLVAWGDNPDLVLTVGGFHPSYRPPALPFPVPDRLSVDILNQPDRLIRVTGYFAITSNTVQFGAKAELRLNFNHFGIEGHLSFDALFQFSPFVFAIDISAGVSLKAFGVGLFGIDLRFKLEGPAPWRAHGRGSIGFLFFEISADFDITWGETRNTTLPPIAVLPMLAAELKKTASWATQLPTGGGKPLVTLRKLPETDDLVLHPLGTLTVRQRALPLDVRLDRIGGQRPSDGRRFGVAPVPNSGLTLVSTTGDKFAMAQFQDMTDAAKLSRPSFETQDAGLELTGASGAFTSPRVVRRSARYELHIVDSGVAPTAPLLQAVGRDAAGSQVDVRQAAGRVAAGRAAVATRSVVAAAPKRFHNVNGAVFDELLRGSSTSRSPLSRREASLRQPFAAADTVRVTEQRYVVAYLRSNIQAFPPGALKRLGKAPFAPSTGSAASTTSAAAAAAAADPTPDPTPFASLNAAASFRNQTTAADALADWVAADPGLAGQLHVIPAAEAAASLAVAGTWSPAGVLPAAAAGIDAVPLVAGKVLIAGGADANGVALAATSLFDPTGNAWSGGAPLTIGRRQHATTRLTDGRVVVTGGRAADSAVLASAEVYDPAAGTWSKAPGELATARFAHCATVLLPSGALLVTGGTAARADDTGRQGDALASVELFDPISRTWSTVAPMNNARSGHQTVRLLDGRVLVVGGAQPTGDGRERALAYCEIYVPGTGIWAPTGSLATARKGHQATLLADGRVLVTGGDAVVAADGTFSPHSLDSAELFDPDTEVWTPAATMPGGRSRHRAIQVRSGELLVIGGTGGPAHTAGYRSVLAYDPAGDAWTTAGGLILGRAAFGVVELADRRVLVAGGVAAAGAAVGAAPGAAAPDPDNPDVIQPAPTGEVLIP